MILDKKNTRNIFENVIDNTRDTNLVSNLAGNGISIFKLIKKSPVYIWGFLALIVLNSLLFAITFYFMFGVFMLFVGIICSFIMDYYIIKSFIKKKLSMARNEALKTLNLYNKMNINSKIRR